MPESMKSEEFMSYLDTLTNEQKKHFRDALEILVQCYGDNPAMQAILVYKAVDSTASSVISANCNDMDGTGMLLAAAEYFHFITTRDAPPKENFN
jgi:hypothetical protein